MASGAEGAAASGSGGSKVTWKRKDGSEVPGLAFGDAGNPGVICMQEWWGIDDEIQLHAAHIAAQGYRVLVPDLYRGKLGVEAEEAHHLMDNLDWGGAVEDIRGAALQLRSEGSSKVGIIGFCMGGALSLAGAVLVEEIDAAAPFYGTPNPALADVSKCKTPVCGHYGGKDPMKGFSSPEDAKKLDEALTEAGCEHQVFVYDTVGHAFMNSSPEGIERKKKNGQGEHDQKAVDLAWERVFAFFEKHIK